MRATDGPPKSSTQVHDFVSKGKTTFLPLRTEKVHGRTFSELP